MKRYTIEPAVTRPYQRVNIQFTNEEDKEQYCLGRNAGRRAARFGRPKMEHLNKKPKFFQDGYNDEYARVKSTVSQAEIAANREKDNESTRERRKNQQQRKRRKIGTELHTEAPGDLAQQEGQKGIVFYQFNPTTEKCIPMKFPAGQLSETLEVSAQCAQSYPVEFFLVPCLENNHEENEDLSEIVKSYPAQTKASGDSAQQKGQEEIKIDQLHPRTDEDNLMEFTDDQWTNSSDLQPQDNLLEPDNLEWSAQNNPGEKEDLLKEGEIYLEKDDSDTLSDNPPKDEEELIKLLKQLNSSNNLAKKVNDLTFFQGTQNSTMPPYGVMHPASSGYSFFSTSNANQGEKDCDVGFFLK
ncbi:hypothetical protein Lnau_0274 [Legionella nautarum]|uniref:Uncharacterized protein n=1 Tax=Legionella nautarum TaxID=45070 RepID=A0A0W0X3L9_9GAMM|nr:hypothetical protein [Legionella nautarum]KTD39205.1 hypothetical protein Lnau_0274 [Legionella nautarum]